MGFTRAFLFQKSFGFIASLFKESCADKPFKNNSNI